MAGTAAAASVVGLVWVLIAGVPGLQGAAQQGVLPWSPAPGTQDQYAGTEMCAMCHPDVATAFTANSHAGATMKAGHPAGDITCEACHGPGLAHADAGGDLELVLTSFDGTEGFLVEAKTCLACHAGSREHAYDMVSEHAAAEVSCTQCHSVHYSETDIGLLKAASPGICYTCHQDVEARFAAAEGHGLGGAHGMNGLLGCETCHSPHGSAQNAMLNKTMVNGELCASCHIDKRGPFVYDHPAGTVEGCVACHESHGSANRFMLKTQDTLELCIQCHTGVPASHNIANPRYRDCTNCHTAIHGSDTHRLFFRR
ncbi:MAG: DmsE family decaheme c-type cytochrome [bacterium]